MREIKFRAWDKADLCMCNVLEMRFDNEELIKVGYTFDGSDDIEKACLRYPSQLELMQYTGLKDKNGKDVFEGDIVEYGGAQFVVEFNHEAFKVKQGRVFYDWPLDWKNLEIIGNVYESPELITTT